MSDEDTRKAEVRGWNILTVRHAWAENSWKRLEPGPPREGGKWSTSENAEVAILVWPTVGCKSGISEFGGHIFGCARPMRPRGGGDRSDRRELGALHHDVIAADWLQIDDNAKAQQESSRRQTGRGSMHACIRLCLSAGKNSLSHAVACSDPLSQISFRASQSFCCRPDGDALSLTPLHWP
jgi:hypothetical protein